MLKKQSGVTLVALVITIIVLLILAAVSIAMLTGDNGILTKSTEAASTTVIADAKEAAQLDVNAKMADYYEAKYTTSASYANFLAYVTAEDNYLTTSDANKYTVGDDHKTITIVPVPKGKTGHITGEIGTNGGITWTDPTT